MSKNILYRGEFKPPRSIRLSQWAQENYVLSPESSAETGHFKPFPFQVGILDAITDPEVTRVSVLKSARVGWTKILNIATAYYMVEDPCAVMMVQPTLSGARRYSKEELGPMLRDCPSVAKIFGGGKWKDARDTILHKSFPGGSVSMVGANSGEGFRMVSRRVLELDEVDGYPLSAGDDGDQIALTIRRSEHFWNRKILMGSTPLVEQTSRITKAYLAGDQRRFYVPCPHCGRMDFLVFRESENGGHFMAWPSSEPEKAHFVCGHGCGSAIEHESKFDMVSAGEWRAKRPMVDGHASFWIWAGYSFSPNAGWGQLAREFVEANKGGVETLRTFMNTVIGEAWIEKGEAPDWEKIQARAEDYDASLMSALDLTLTMGVDVQKNRLVYEVVAWDEEFRSWSLEYGEIFGDPNGDEVWEELDKIRASEWFGKSIKMTAVDSGAIATTRVYEYSKEKGHQRVMAVKGGHNTQRTIIAPPNKVEITKSGKLLGKTLLFMVGGSLIKPDIYAWLNVKRGDSKIGPRGMCHFPKGYPDKYYQELTAEHLVAVMKRTGFETYEWRLLPNRENHVLDCRVYARAAAARLNVGAKSSRKRATVSAHAEHA